MNRKAALCIMFASFIILTEGNTVTLLQVGTAESGKPLGLQCVYNGAYNPFTFNFYLNPDTNGLQISVSNCMIAIAVGYNTSLYNQSCGTNNVSLIILAVSWEQNGQKWECDVSFITADPIPPKASTIINVTAATTTTSTTSTTTKETVTSASKSPTAGSTVNATSTSKPTTPETIGSASSPTNISSQGGTDTKVIVIAVVVPIGGLLLIVIIVLCIRNHWTGKKGHDIPDGMAAQDRGNNVDGFKHDRTAKQFNAIPSTSDGFILYPGPAAMSTARPNKERKYLNGGYQYRTPYTGCQTAYVPSTYPSAKSSTHKDTKHHNVGHPYISPYTRTYGNLTAYSPKNKSYDYESPYQIAASRPAYDRTAYYPQTGYYEHIGQDVNQRGSGQYSYGQRSRPHQDHNGKQQQKEYYYNQYEMADYGDSRTRYGQTKHYGLD